MKNFKKLLFSFLFFALTFSANAQLWKKLKNKAQQKLENKIEKEADKKVDSLLYGKKKTEKPDTIDNQQKSYGSASINHSILYGNFSVNDLSKTKVNKEGKKATIKGYWRTSSADVFDGYILTINNLENIEELSNKTFKIPEEATLKLAYNALVKGEYIYKRGQEHAPQNFELISGTATITFHKDKNVSLNFSGDVKLDNHKDNEDFVNNTLAVINGMINTNEPEFIVTKVIANASGNKANTELSESDKVFLKEKLSPTVNIPSSFSFNKSIKVEMTDSRGEKTPMEFLLGNYPDIYGISVSAKEMQGQGAVTMVMTPKSSTAFMDVAGMKMKRSTSIAQIESQYNMTNKLPEGADFEYKKTGNTKTILGYNCQEYKVTYNYTNATGSASFWVAKDFPIQNIEMPMLGMKMNNPYLEGFVLELNSNHQGQNFNIKVIEFSNKNLLINSSEYKTMGF